MTRPIAIAAMSLMLAAGCGHAQYAKVTAWGQDHKVTFYPPVGPPEVFHTKGAVQNEGESDGYFFQDAATGRVVRLSGAVKIEITN